MADEARRSVARGFGVGPSPLNAVKLDLAVIGAVGLLLALVLHALGGAPWVQFGILFAYGVMGMAWLLVRTRRVLRETPAPGEPADGP